MFYTQGKEIMTDLTRPSAHHADQGKDERAITEDSRHKTVGGRDETYTG